MADASDPLAFLDDLDDLDDSVLDVVADANDASNLLPLTLDGLSSVDCATSAPLRPSRQKRTRSSTYDPNRARNLRRHELVYLRDKVAEMEAELARLQRVTTCPPTFPSSELVPSSSAGTGMWERIAVRQRTERQRAERENERLKIVLETQLKVAKALEAIVHKRAVVEGLNECGLGPQRRALAWTANTSDAETFQFLLDQVHACYLNAEAHLASIGIDATDAACRDARIRDDANDASVIMELFVNDVLPFPVQATAQAAWRYFSDKKNSLSFRCSYERLRELPDDTIVELSGLALHFNGTDAVFHSKQVIRRYLEPDRVVIAYSSITETVEFAGRAVDGLNFSERGCMVLQRPTSLEDADAHCVLKACYFITPSYATDDARARDAVTEFMLHTTAEIMGAWLQRIENILVDELVGSGG